MGREVAGILCREEKTTVETIDKALGIVIRPRGVNFKLEPRFVLWVEENFSSKTSVLSLNKR